jgi:predicted methyltransferase MtxX (methanogen marker protein 4)
MELESLVSLTSPDAPVGIGLSCGDPREPELLAGARFCPVTVYQDPALMLQAIDSGEIRSGVRGSLSSSAFLEELKTRRGRLALRRVALLILPCGRPFLLGPVGIDEGGTLRSMRLLMDDCKEFCAVLGWEPRIAVLSAGRAEDSRRSVAIKRSIERGERLAAEEADVRHFHITIEEAVQWANCVIAPDGVTGNLIYRTLVHLGSGNSMGALYFPLSLKLADTSRNGTVEEYLGAIALANIAAGSNNRPRS